MPAYEPMALRLETERLSMRPWAESDAGSSAPFTPSAATGLRPLSTEPEIAYELFRRAHGRGYATEAARAVLEAAIATGRKRLWSTVGSWNTPSSRVLEKLGFERDHVSAGDGGEVVWLTRLLP
jgi:RimJ/RimL family protein N-acetyltransferase